MGYFSRLVARCSCLLRSKELAPEEVVTVYHIVHLMLFSCSNNADILKRCRKSFKEEVRLGAEHNMLRSSRKWHKHDVVLCTYTPTHTHPPTHTRAHTHNTCINEAYCVTPSCRYYLRLSVCQSIIADHVPLKQRTLQLLKELKSLLLEPLSS